MRRSLHLKLMLIMVLLIVSLMVVVGAFLMNSVTRYYIDDFYQQMADAFGQDNADFIRDLQSSTEGETNGAARVEEVLRAYGGTLGVDRRNRNYYVLDGGTGRYLAGSSPASTAAPPPTTWTPPSPSPGTGRPTSSTSWTTGPPSAP